MIPRLQTMLWHHNTRVNSHQRWKQMQFRVCFHLWCEQATTMNVTKLEVSWNSWVASSASYIRNLFDFISTYRDVQSPSSCMFLRILLSVPTYVFDSKQILSHYMYKCQKRQYLNAKIYQILLTWWLLLATSLVLGPLKIESIWNDRSTCSLTANCQPHFYFVLWRKKSNALMGLHLSKYFLI